MDISSIVTAGVLSGALVFGQTTAETEYPKELNEVTYNLVPAYVQEINWSDNSEKLNKLHTVSYVDSNGVVRIYNQQDYKDDTAVMDGLIEIEEDNTLENGDSDEQYVGTRKTNNNGNVDNINGNNDGYYVNRKGFLYSEMQYLEEMYKNAGFKHITVKFPVTKSEPYLKSKKNFYEQLPFNEIDEVAVYGFASPDGRIPEMQEALAEKRKNKIISYFAEKGIGVESSDYYVCDKSVTRSMCWKVDIFYK